MSWPQKWKIASEMGEIVLDTMRYRRDKKTTEIRGPLEKTVLLMKRCNRNNTEERENACKDKIFKTNNVIAR